MMRRTLGRLVTLAFGLLVAPLAAQALGLTIPPSLLVQADEVLR